MGTSNPSSEDSNIKLARAQEKIKNLNQHKKKLDQISQTLHDKEEEIKKNKEQNFQTHELLVIEEKKVEYLQIALNESKQNIIIRGKKSLTISIVSDIFFLLSSVLTGWGINNLSSAPPSNAGYILLTSGMLIFIVNAIASKILASGKGA